MTCFGLLLLVAKLCLVTVTWMMTLLGHSSFLRLLLLVCVLTWYLFGYVILELCTDFQGIGLILYCHVSSAHRIPAGICYVHIDLFVYWCTHVVSHLMYHRLFKHTYIPYISVCFLREQSSIVVVVALSANHSEI